MKYFVIGIAGIIGALLRYGISILPAISMFDFPVSTLIVNYIGCFLLGWFLTRKNEQLPEWFHKGFSTGLIGSFTTFSTFAVDVVRLAVQGSWWMVSLYLLLSVWGGLFLTWAGHQVAGRQMIVRGEEG